VSFLVALAVASQTAHAAEPTKAECADAYEKAQRLDQAGRFVEAKEELLICGSSSCPALLQRDCVTWLGPLTTKTPTVVLSVHDAKGQPRLDARILLDGAPVTAPVGRGFPVDPGPHELRVEAADMLAVTRSIVAREGVTNQPVDVLLEPAPAAAVVPGVSPRETAERAGPPALAWVFGAVSVVGLASFAYFGLSGKAAEQDLDRCTPRCADGPVDEVQTRYVVADVSLLAGVITGGIAAWLFASGAAPEPKRTARRAAP
jgi:hypothetical protein